jgi:DNA-binding transcriptional LysR family regulator
VVDLIGEGVDVDPHCVTDRLESDRRKLADNKRVVVASPDYIKRHGAPRSIDELSSHNCLRIQCRWQPARLDLQAEW